MPEFKENLCEDYECICKKTPCIKLHSELLYEEICYPHYKVLVDTLKYGDGDIHNDFVIQCSSTYGNDIVIEYAINGQLHQLYPGNNIEYDNTRFIISDMIIGADDITAYLDIDSFLYHTQEIFKNRLYIIDNDDIFIRINMYNIENNEKTNGIISMHCITNLAKINAPLNNKFNDEQKIGLKKLIDMYNCVVLQSYGRKKCATTTCWNIIDEPGNITATKICINDDDDCGEDCGDDCGKFIRCHRCKTKQCKNCDIPIKFHFDDYRHIITCQQAKINNSNDDFSHLHEYLFGENVDTQTCPTCTEMVSLLDGCNTVKCSNCKNMFCWVCGMGKLNQKYKNPHEHFNNDDVSKLCAFLVKKDLESRDLVYFKKTNYDHIRNINKKNLPLEWNKYLINLLETEQYNIFSDPLKLL